MNLVGGSSLFLKNLGSTQIMVDLPSALARDLGRRHTRFYPAPGLMKSKIAASKPTSTSNEI